MRGAVLLVALALAGVARAEPSSGPGSGPAEPTPGTLADADALFAEGRHAEAALVLRPLVAGGGLARTDRAHALRLLGLSLFFVGSLAEADAALFAYLSLEPDAHLDPSVIPPDGVIFLETVRVRHGGELALIKRRPWRRRYAVLSLVPPVGQIQNGERGKAWVLGSLEVAALGANLGTYVALRSMCSSYDRTCDDPDAARALQVVNILSGITFLAVYTYGVIDGYLEYRRLERRPGWQATVAVDTRNESVIVGYQANLDW